MKFSLEKNKKCEKAKLLPLKNLRLSHKTVARPIGVRAGGGGRGGLQPPQILDNSDFLGSKREFGQSLFLKTSQCLFNYFEDLNINLKSA